ncbi:MAG: hypothetical protein ACOX6T_09835 [Myxococcales bacterium]|jgi:hypothetical protein
MPLPLSSRPWLVLVTIGFLFGCTNDPIRPIDDSDLEEIPKGIHLRPGIEIRFASEASGAVLDKEAKTVTLTGEAATTNASLKAGDILGSETWAVRVVSVEKSGDAIIAAVEQIYLTDVIYGDFDLELPLELGEGSSFDVDENGNISSQKQSLSIPGWDPEITASAEGKLNVGVEGGISFPASATGRFKGKIGLIPIKEVLVKFDLGMQAQLTVFAEAVASGSVSISNEFANVPLGDIPLGTTGLSLKPSMVFEGTLSGSAMGKVRVEATANASLNVPVGFHYTDREGLRMIPNDTYPITTSGGISAGVTNEARAEASLDLRVRLVLGLGIVAIPAKLTGPNASVGVYAEGVYEPFANPECLTAEVGPQACIMAAFGFEVFGISKQFELNEWCLKHALAKYGDKGKFCLEAPSPQELADMLNAAHEEVDCEDPSLQQGNLFEGTCLEDFTAHCFDPEGECQGTVYENGRVIQRWPSGEVLEMWLDRDGIDESKPMRLIDRNQQLCSEGVVEEGGPGGQCISGSTLTLHQDDPSEKYEDGDEVLTCMSSPEQFDVTCPDGVTHHITFDSPKQQAAAQICSRGGPCKFVAEFGPGPDDLLDEEQ